MSVRMIQYLLTALLFLTQSALLIHQSDFDAHLASGDSCAICHVAPSLDGVAGYISPFISVPVTLPESTRFTHRVTFNLAYLLPGIRSPPRTTGI